MARLDLNKLIPPDIRNTLSSVVQPQDLRIDSDTPPGSRPERPSHRTNNAPQSEKIDEDTPDLQIRKDTPLAHLKQNEAAIKEDMLSKLPTEAQDVMAQMFTVEIDGKPINEIINEAIVAGKEVDINKLVHDALKDPANKGKIDEMAAYIQNPENIETVKAMQASAEAQVTKMEGKSQASQESTERDDNAKKQNGLAGLENMMESLPKEMQPMMQMFAMVISLLTGGFDTQQQQSQAQEQEQNKDNKKDDKEKPKMADATQTIVGADLPADKEKGQFTAASTDISNMNFKDMGITIENQTFNQNDITSTPTTFVAAEQNQSAGRGA